MAEIREVLYQHHHGVTQRCIEKSLGISRMSIRKYISMANGFGYTSDSSTEELEGIAIKVHNEIITLSAANRPSKSKQELKLYHEKIESLLSERWITHQQIYRILTAQGLATSRRSLSRYIAHCFPTLPKATVHLLTKPGHEAQVDYAYVGLINNKKTYAFIMTLSHSRYRYVEFVHSQDHLSWAQSHINAFHFFGGVPHCVLLDNLKSGVLKADIYDPTLNETYSELARFYGFIADPAKARTPEHKGKVERSVQLVKEQVIAGMHYDNLAALNAFGRDWCTNKVAHVVCSTTGEKPVDVFNNEEIARLKPLPSSAFDMPIWTEGQVHRDHHFVISGNFYSVPTQYIGSQIQIRVGLKTVKAYANHALIKTHVRQQGKGQWATDPGDYHKSARFYLENSAEVCIANANAIGQATEHMTTVVLADGSRLALRKAQAILRLAGIYGNERLEEACLRALLFDNYSQKSLKKILEEGLDKKNTSTFSTRREIESNTGAYLRPASEYTSTMEAHYV
ncbi:MAG: IS21 family transposase [Tatlockia sp.]|nr:IS21 family transposase [Tatlockia sp.]